MAISMRKKFAYIDPDKCQRCEVCPPQKECTNRAIWQDPQDNRRIVDIGCRGCANCLTRCPHRAIRIVY